jgi:hypothetical protein
LARGSSMDEFVGQVTPVYIGAVIASFVLVGWITCAVEAYDIRRLSKFLISVGATVLAISAVLCTVDDPVRPPFVMFAVLTAGTMGRMAGRGRQRRSEPPVVDPYF